MLLATARAATNRPPSRQYNRRRDVDGGSHVRLTGNTVLITGGGSGIGRALAELFHARDNRVIIAGRRQANLDDVVAAHPGVESLPLDVARAESIAELVAELRASAPSLNVVVHNAGVMRPEEIGDGDLPIAEATIMTNLLGPIRLNSALLPMLRRQADGAIMTVTSGLAFVPRGDYPSYCATKAAIHSYTQSLRGQLSGTRLQVIELIPPFVQTELQGPEQLTDPRAMPLADYIAEVVELLESHPDADEICVPRAMFQRTAESSGEYAARFRQLNERYGVAAAP
jgi:uncharacterized oxidoreductase